MDKVMLVVAIVASVLGAIWVAVIVIAGRQLDVHEQRVAEAEAALAELEAKLEAEQPLPHVRDHAGYKRGT